MVCNEGDDKDDDSDRDDDGKNGCVLVFSHRDNISLDAKSLLNGSNNDGASGSTGLCRLQLHT